MAFIADVVRDFLTAVVSFTRIPASKNLKNFDVRAVSRSMMFFPLVGALIGFVCWGAWFLLRPLLPHDVLVLVLLIMPILITGAYHEDGFADVCDSYGGYTKERMLEIMKDSRIGVFAAIGIVFLLFMKFLLLRELHAEMLPIAILTAMVLGRFSAMLPFKIWMYVGRTNSTSHILNFSYITWIVAAIIGIGILSFVIGLSTTVFMFLSIQILVLILGAYFQRKYGGLTGDMGGAMEQVGEVSVYFIFMLISYGTLSL